MKKTMRKLLCELLKDSKRSDRKLAKVLGVSQATVSRMRNKLVKDGMIQEFTILPDFPKMGYEIMAISLAQTKMGPEIEEKAKKYMNKHPNVIFVARAEGMGKNGLMISLHKDYADYSHFFMNHLVYWRDIIENHEEILVSLKGPFVKPFSLRYLAEREET